LRCKNDSCGFVFLDSEASSELYGDDYFEAYAGGDYLAAEERRRHESKLRLDILESVVPPPARLLEVGAAAGFFLDEARARAYDGVGIEPNTAMAAHARETLKLDVRTGLLSEVELEPASFDAACAFHVVEHLPDPLGSLLNVRDALCPGGHLLVEVPNAESAAARQQGPNWKPLDLPYHVGHHGPQSLEKLMERAGFEILRVDTVPFAHYGGGSRAMGMAAGGVGGVSGVAVIVVLPEGERGRPSPGWGGWNRAHSPWCAEAVQRLSPGRGGGKRRWG